MSYSNVTIPADSTASNSLADIPIGTAILLVAILASIALLLFTLLGWLIERDSPLTQSLPRWALLPLIRILTIPWWLLGLPYYRIYLDYIWWPMAQVKINVVYMVEVLGVLFGAIRARVAVYQ